jgi:hypothetical protein
VDDQSRLARNQPGNSSASNPKMTSSINRPFIQDEPRVAPSRVNPTFSAAAERGPQLDPDVRHPVMLVDPPQGNLPRQLAGGQLVVAGCAAQSDASRPSIMLADGSARPRSLTRVP